MHPPEQFERIATRYDATIPRHVRDHYLRKRVQLLTRVFGKGRILDVGCGTGLLIEALTEEGMCAIGVDGSAAMLRVMKTEARGDGVRALSRRLPFRDAAFDGTVCVALLHHLMEVDAVRATISEMVRVTRRGGHVVIWDHNPANPYWPRIMSRVPQDSGLERLVGEREIVEALRRAGIGECRVLKLGLMPDFAPARLLPLFRLIEQVVESLPLIRRLCAHNVVIARKR